ncbi:thioredoxin [Desulfosarcina sp.]|uniref:thioredoxin n=1 Tax=Desulfosarcina sp. TaxID=2027861 RepID=UPI003561B980
MKRENQFVLRPLNADKIQQQPSRRNRFMSEFVTEIENNQFDRQVLQQAKPVIVDFWAPWCGPCKAMAPAFASLAETYKNQMIFTKCDVDSHTAVAERYGIKSIPTLMIFQGGKAINSITGMVSQGVLENAIKKALAGDAMPAPFIVN